MTHMSQMTNLTDVTLNASEIDAQTPKHGLFSLKESDKEFRLALNDSQNQPTSPEQQ